MAVRSQEMLSAWTDTAAAQPPPQLPQRGAPAWSRAAASSHMPAYHAPGGQTLIGPAFEATGLAPERSMSKPDGLQIRWDGLRSPYFIAAQAGGPCMHGQYGAAECRRCQWQLQRNSMHK